MSDTCAKTPACVLPSGHTTNCEPPKATCIEDVVRDYVQAGPYMRRKDASPKFKSPLLSLADVVELARADIAKAEGK